MASLFGGVVDGVWCPECAYGVTQSLCRMRYICPGNKRGHNAGVIFILIARDRHFYRTVAIAGSMLVKIAIGAILILRRGIKSHVEVLSNRLRWAIEMGRPLEVFGETFKTPTWVAKLLPCIVVCVRTSIPLHAVDDRTPTHNIAHIYRPSLVVHKWLWSRRDWVVVIGIDVRKVRYTCRRPIVNHPIFDD